ncbi:porin, partial [Yoonia sp.]|uniref:porin n=1 Tax=Yoonia sp. TaxID=2212373 RepID=UPI002DFBD993|nr:porin [Yoonia sp.]
GGHVPVALGVAAPLLDPADLFTCRQILLTTTAIVAFAGAAAADGHTSIAFSGGATLGYNDDIEDGFYWDSDIDVTGSAALDNGITASVSAELNIASDDAADGNVDAQFDELVISIASESASLSFGDVDPVAEDNYGGVDGDSTTGFNDLDAHFDVVGFDAMLVGEVSVAGVTAMVSYGVFNDEAAAPGDLDVIDALQVYATGDFGMFSVEAAYQDELTGLLDYSVFGVSATAAVAGAEITAAYIANTEDAGNAIAEESSFGLGVSYPVGPVTLGGYYSVNDVAEDSYGVSADYVDGPIAVNAFYDFEGNTGSATEVNEFGIEGSYDTGMNLTVLAGYISTEVGAADATAQTYVAGVYDLGGGGKVLVAYAEDEADATNDEIGDPEYKHGTTVAVSFSF